MGRFFNRRGPSKAQIAQFNKQLASTNNDLQKENKHMKNFLKRDGFMKKSRGSTPLGLTSGTVVRNGIFEPLVDPRFLILAPENNWVLGAIIDKIMTEATKDPDLYEWVPAFAAKCTFCGEEYDETEPEECENCGGEDFRKADKSQLDLPEALFSHPNNDGQGRVKKTLKDIIKNLIYYRETIDDYYLEVTKNFWGDPAEIFPMTSESIRILEGEDGTKWLSGDKFCPRCYESDQTYSDNRAICPDCGGDLKETTYIQLDGWGQHISARWADDEVIHDNARAWGNRVYGFPKVWSVWVLAQILKWMEYYQWSAYSKNEMPDSFTVFVDMAQEDVNDMISQVMAYKKENPEARKNLWLGAESGTAPVHVKTMPNFTEMQSLEMAQFYREALCMRYGVSLAFMGVPTPGKLGDEGAVVEVSTDTIAEVQTQMNETVNTKLLPLFKANPVTEWEWRLRTARKDDKAKEAQVRNQNVASVVSLRSSGINAILDEKFEPEIIDQPAPKDPTDYAMPGAGGDAGGAFQYSKSSFHPQPQVINYPDGSTAVQYQNEPPIFFKGVQKSTTSRNIPQGKAIASIRAVEDDFAKSIIDEYDAAVERIMASGGSKQDKIMQIERLGNDLTKSLNEKARGFYREAYMKGLEEEMEALGKDTVKFGQVDQAALDYLAKKPKGVFDSISTFGENQVEKFRGIIEESYATPGGLDLPKMVKRMREASDGGKYELTRIARCETTKIANSGRAKQWEKYADPDKKEYHWIIANHPHGDKRTTDICKAIANGGTVEIWGKNVTLSGNPYTLKEVEKITQGFFPHFQCRSTVVRIPSKAGGGEP